MASAAAPPENTTVTAYAAPWESSMFEITATPTHFLGFPVADFLLNYWQKKPLLIRQAFPNYQAPLTPEDLAGLACEAAAHSRLITYQRKKNTWKMRSGPFEEEEFPKLGKKDWILQVQEMDKWDRDVRMLLEHFRFLPAWRIDGVTIGFATSGGSTGPYANQQDVFLLQTQGQNCWKIDTDPNAAKNLRVDNELKLLQPFKPSQEWLLQPGDMLYLPPGIAHQGEAVGAGMIFSIEMRAPAHAELILDFAEELASSLPEHACYADANLSEASDAFEIEETALAQLDLALLSLQSTSDAKKRDWFGRFITRSRVLGEFSSASKAPSLMHIEKTLRDGGLLLRHPFTRTAWTKSNDQALLFICGESFAMDVDSARILASHDALDAATFAQLSASAREVLETQLQRGHYQLQRPRRSRL